MPLAPVPLVALINRDRLRLQVLPDTALQRTEVLLGATELRAGAIKRVWHGDDARSQASYPHGMAAIDMRGDPPVPTLLRVNLPVHVVVRMTAEVGVAELVKGTPLTYADLEAASRYYRQHPAAIDALLRDEAEVGREFVRRIESDPQLETRVRAASSGPTIPLEEFGRR